MLYLTPSVSRAYACLLTASLTLLLDASVSYGFGPTTIRSIPGVGEGFSCPSFIDTEIWPKERIRALLKAFSGMSDCISPNNLNSSCVVARITSETPDGCPPAPIVDGWSASRGMSVGGIGTGSGGFHVACLRKSRNCMARPHASGSSLKNQISTGILGLPSSNLRNSLPLIWRGAKRCRTSSKDCSALAARSRCCPASTSSLPVRSWAPAAFSLASADRASALAIETLDSSWNRTNSASLVDDALEEKYKAKPPAAAARRVKNTTATLDQNEADSNSGRVIPLWFLVLALVWLWLVGAAIIAILWKDYKRKRDLWRR